MGGGQAAGALAALLVLLGVVAPLVFEGLHRVEEVTGELYRYAETAKPGEPPPERLGREIEGAAAWYAGALQGIIAGGECNVTVAYYNGTIAYDGGVPPSVVEQVLPLARPPSGGRVHTVEASVGGLRVYVTGYTDWVTVAACPGG